METTLRNKNSSKICVSNFMLIGAPGIVFWRFSRYFWNTPRSTYEGWSKITRTTNLCYAVEMIFWKNQVQ